MRKLLAAVLLLYGLSPFALAADLTEELLAMEKTLWTAWSKKDGEPFKKALAADALQIVAGVKPLAGREAIIKEVTSHGCVVKGFAFQDPKLRKLGAEAAVLNYVATQDASCGAQKLPPKVMATSIYVKQKGKWTNVQYQETPID